MGLNISRKKLFVFAILVSIIRLTFTAFQRATFLPDTSMLDDYLMYSAAKSVTAGNWLGAYGFMTIGKHMLFSVWLAFLHMLNIPYLFAGQFLYVLSSLALVFSFSPVIKNRTYLLFFYTILIFNPASYADFTLRVYRDNISISFCLLVFASIIGFALRVEQEKKVILWFYGILGGLSLGASFLLREDGIWILPFVIVGIVICIIKTIQIKEKGRIRVFLPLSMVAVFSLFAISTYSMMNYIHYGRYIISDMTSKEFYDACGAMTRVIVPDDEYNPIVTLPYSSRKKLYDNCPTFAELEPLIESNYFHRMKKDVGDGVNDISGGGYYWAVRNAASLLGYYTDSESAKEFYIKLAEEINTACDNGLIDATGPRSTINAPITANRIIPTLNETISGTLSVLLYKDITCAPEPSLGSDVAIANMEQFLNTNAFRLDKIYTDNKLIIITTYSTKGAVETSLVDKDGNVIDFMTSNATGSDIYVDELLQNGTDTIYTEYLRKYLSFSNSIDSVALRLSINYESYEVSPIVTDGLIELGSLKYGIEYVGNDYSLGDTASYMFLELWVYRAMRIVTFLYKFIMPIIFILGIISVYISISKRKKIRKEDKNLLLLISIGIILMAFLRLGMVAYIEVSAFGIGTYPMYFAVAYPLFISFSFTAIYNVKKVVSFPNIRAFKWV